MNVMMKAVRWVKPFGYAQDNLRVTHHQGKKLMSFTHPARAYTAKICRVAVWLVASTIFFGGAQANAAGENKKNAAVESVIRLPFGGVAPFPGALAISSDGSTAAHIGSNGDVVLWDAVKIKPLETIPGDGKKPSAVALSHDGDLIAIGYFDARVIVRSRREHKVLQKFSGHTGGISALAFSLDDKMLASGGDDATAQVWELSTGKRLRVFDSMSNGDISTGSGIPVSLGFSGNGRVLVVNEWYSRFYDVGRGATLWDIEEGIEISTRDAAPPNSDNTMRAGQALGGGGWLLAYTGREGLMAERLDLCDSPRKLPAGRYAETVAADPQGRWVAASEVEQLTFFGMGGNKKSYAITLPAKAIALVVHPDGRSVFALMIAETRVNGNENFIGGRDAETVTGSALYRIPVPQPLWQLPPLDVKADATHCPPTEAVRKVQDFKFPEKPLELRATTDTENSLITKKTFPKFMRKEMQDDSASASDSDTGEVYRLVTGHFERYGVHGKRLKDVPLSGAVTAFAARNGRLAALYADGRIQVWPFQAGGKSKTTKLLSYMEDAQACGGPEFKLSADGNYVQITCEQGPDAPEIYPIYSIHSAKRVAWGPLLTPFPGRSNRGVAQDTRPYHLAVWDLDKGEIIARLPRHRSRDQNGNYKPLLAAISDDGRLLASASYDGLVRVWNLDTRQMVGEANLGDETTTQSQQSQPVRKRARRAGEASTGSAVTTMAFDSAGKQLAVGREDGQLFVLQMPGQSEQQPATDGGAEKAPE